MWAQSWNNILNLVLPYPDKPPEDITAIMKIQVSTEPLDIAPPPSLCPTMPLGQRATEPQHLFFSQHWKPEKMFEEANLFFTSMGMLPVPSTFWMKSMLEKPVDGREVECHPSSWNFYKFNDFRCLQPVWSSSSIFLLPLFWFLTGHVARSKQERAGVGEVG